MRTPKELVLPPKPPAGLSARLPNGRRTEVLQEYVIKVCDALARACRDQVGAILPEPAVIAAHFEVFTVEQARLVSLVLHARYGMTLPVSGARA